MQLPWSPEVFLHCGSQRTIVCLGSQILFDEASCIAYYPDMETVVAVGTEAAMLQHSAQAAVVVIWPFVADRVSDPIAARLFLVALLRRIEQQSGALGKVFGVRGRYIHPTKASPAQLHVYQQVLQQAGVPALQPTALAIALAAAGKESAGVSQYGVCSISSDRVECMVLAGSDVVHVREIRWGTERIYEMIRRELYRSEAAQLSLSDVERVASELLDCSLVIDSKQLAQKRTAKISLKAVKHSESTSTTIVVSQNELLPALAQTLQSLAEQVAEFLETLPAETVRSISEVGIQLVGEGKSLSGLPVYLSHVFGAEVVWQEQPEYQAIQGMLRLSGKSGALGVQQLGQ